MTFILDGKKVWVAGHRGMVGSALMRHLAGRNCTLLTAERAALDLTRQQAVETFVAQEKPEVIFMAAARVGGIWANKTFPAEFLYQNLAIQQNIIEAAHKAGCQKLVFLASACMYPRDAAQPIREDALLTGLPEPTNEAYAIAKIAGTKLCQFYRQQYGHDFITVVPTNSYGPEDNFDPQTSHVPAALMLKYHLAKRDNAPNVTLWGTGAPLRDFMFVDDMASAICFAVENYSEAEPLNVGTGEEFSIRKLANAIRKAVGYIGENIHDTSKPDGAPRKLMDCSRLMQMGWRPAYSLQQGIERTYKWFQEHEEQILGKLDAQQKDTGQ